MAAEKLWKSIGKKMTGNGKKKSDMKTINLEQIREMTKCAIIRREKNKKERAAKAKADEKREKKERIEQIKKNVLEFYPEEIKKAAKAGRRKYSMGFAFVNDGKIGADARLEKKYIEEYLKEFNPTFKVVSRTGTDYDYEGCSIGHFIYNEMEVRFTW